MSARAALYEISTLRCRLNNIGTCTCKYVITVDLVIFACLNFRAFLILGLFTKFRVRIFLFFFSSAIRKIFFTSFLNSPICLLREICEN